MALEPIEWLGLSQIATVGGRLNDCENFKKDLSGGAVVLCACFPNRNMKMKLLMHNNNSNLHSFAGLILIHQMPGWNTLEGVLGKVGSHFRGGPSPVSIFDMDQIHHQCRSFPKRNQLEKKIVVLNAGNFRERSQSSLVIISPATPSNPQQPIHSLRKTHQ